MGWVSSSMRRLCARPDQTGETSSAKLQTQAERQNRVHRITRKDLLAVTMEEMRSEYLDRIGQRLERTTEQLRWRFKRASNWECDQTIEDIHYIHGAGFERGMTMATKFSAEWKPILVKPTMSFVGPPWSSNLKNLSRSQQADDYRQKIMSCSRVRSRRTR